MIVNIKYNLRKIRRLRKLTIQELSDLSEVGIATISGIENNKLNPSTETMVRLAVVLNCKVDNLFYYTIE